MDFTLCTGCSDLPRAWSEGKKRWLDMSLAAVEEQMGVEQRTETVDEDHSAEAGHCTGTGTVLPQRPFDGAQEDAQSDVENRRITRQVIAPALGHRKHRLTQRQTPDDVVGQMRRRLGHAAGSAGRADAATLA